MNIKSLNPVLVPTQLGTMNVHLYGLGEDNKVYAWDVAVGEWGLLKAPEPKKPEPKKADNGEK